MAKCTTRNGGPCRLTDPGRGPQAAKPTDDTTTRPAFPTDASTGPSTAGLNEDALPSCGRDNTTWYVTTTRLIEKCRHTGNIRVQAPNVIIRNVVVRGTGTGVIIHNESTGLP